MTARRAHINFHSNLRVFKAEVSVIESQQEKGMAVKTVDKALLQGQSVELGSGPVGLRAFSGAEIRFMLI